MNLHFTDGTITIRPYRAADVDSHFEAICASRKEISKWLPWGDARYARDNSAAWIATHDDLRARRTAFPFAICRAQDDVFLGGIGLNGIHPVHGFGNIFYWVRTDTTSRGVATRATRLIARFGFEELGLARLEIVVAVDNQASQRVAEKAGATREGVLRNRLIRGNGFGDAVMFSLIPQDLNLPVASREGLEPRRSSIF